MSRELFKRLDPKEAQNLYEAKSRINPDGTTKWLSEPIGFTLTPSTDPKFPAEDGWEDVRYYTSRRKDVYKNMHQSGDGYVYIMVNESMPGMVKVGYTSDRVGPEERAKSLSTGTGVPTPYKDVFSFRCFNGEVLERMVHDHLSPYRVNSKREHFYVTVGQAKEAIKELGKGFTNETSN